MLCAGSDDCVDVAYDIRPLYNKTLKLARNRVCIHIHERMSRPKVTWRGSESSWNFAPGSKSSKERESSWNSLPGAKVPGNESSRERKFHTMVLSLPGAKVP